MASASPVPVVNPPLDQISRSESQVGLGESDVVPQNTQHFFSSLLPETHHPNQVAAGTASKHAVTPAANASYLYDRLGFGPQFILSSSLHAKALPAYRADLSPPLDETGEAVERQTRHTFVHLTTTFADRWTANLINSRYLGQSGPPLNDSCII
jgi:hypothetical protein